MSSSTSHHILISSFYLPSISHFKSWMNAEKIYVDHFSAFKKSTERNRCRIASANGMQQLSVPIHGGRSAKNSMKNVLIAEDHLWTRVHWGALHSNYGKSSYFHFYEDELKEIFSREIKRLADLNLELLRLCLKWLNSNATIQAIEEENELKELEYSDLREQSIHFNLKPYHQVFSAKNGFIEGLSMVDLIFNLGPDANGYLQETN